MAAMKKEEINHISCFVWKMLHISDKVACSFHQQIIKVNGVVYHLHGLNYIGLPNKSPIETMPLALAIDKQPQQCFSLE